MEREALAMRKAIAERLQTCGLELHPEKTKIVYCKDPVPIYGTSVFVRDGDSWRLAFSLNRLD
jgi:hypothetical protein